MPFVLSPRSALASPLRLRSSSVAAAAARGSFILRSGHRPGARRLHVALAADNDRLGCGLVTLDYLATVDAYPRPDDKIRTGELKLPQPAASLLTICFATGAFFGNAAALQISGRGNAGNALTAARLGLNTRVISKISDGGNTKFVYIIIDKKTRTCILTPGDPPIVPSDLPMSSLSAALQDVSLLYLDGYSPEMALVVAKQTPINLWKADQMKIPILVDAEQERTQEELEGLLSLASYIVCSGKFPKFMGVSARGLGTVFGRLLIGTAEVIPASELVDTTGCGDAFIGAVLHALSAEMPAEKMLPFASQVAGIKCRAVGARGGLPWRSDQRLAKYL
ncbi:ketohexokinase-like isoform X2 [Panicum miliaceum]|uniref:Ketohexokinase-like isoform X2 n=1 Tax=Panicum miliaceum TaxID=4540 RepID=A0A3L6SCZ6_PANMI|nr:ketohexokinase-like isoform X2 [Panicum miliaceum]